MSEDTRRALLAAAADARERPAPPPRPGRPGPERPDRRPGPASADPDLLERAATELAELEAGAGVTRVEAEEAQQRLASARPHLVALVEERFEAAAQRHAAALHAAAAALQRREEAVERRERDVGQGRPPADAATVAAAREVERAALAADLAAAIAEVERLVGESPSA